MEIMDPDPCQVRAQDPRGYLIRPKNPDPVFVDQEDARPGDTEVPRDSRRRRWVKKEAAKIKSSREDQGI